MKKILPIVVIALFSFVFYEVYTQATKSVKVKRVECQSKTVTFEKIFVEEPIKESINLFLTNNYEVNSHMEYSKYMKSHLKDILTKEQADELLENVIKAYVKNKVASQEKVSINYYIYENDKEDTGKKGAKSKLYAGYLVFEFKLGNKLIYKIQTDYMDIDAKDVAQRMDCAINSFVSIIK